MSATSGKISRKGPQAIAALLSEPTHEAAAKKAGIGTATLSRWLADPTFQSRYRLAQREAFASAVARLQSASGLAAETLAQEMTGDRAGDRIRAALGVLEHAFRARELGEMESRLTKLEKLLAEMREKHERENEPS